jgi:hypothetical protein
MHRHKEKDSKTYDTLLLLCTTSAMANQSSTKVSICTPYTQFTNQEIVCNFTPLLIPIPTLTQITN